MTDPLIRRATLHDAETLSTLGAVTFVETFGHLYPPGDLRGFLTTAYGLDRTRHDLLDPDQASWIVEADGVAIGYALAGLCGLPHAIAERDDGELKRFYLVKAWQNRGLGRRLFEQVLDWLEAGGPRNIWIGVWSQNLGAQRFYARHGFEKVGEYDFPVGSTLDREFILRRDAHHTGRT